MRVVEEIRLCQELDPWLSLEALSRYSGLSVRTLRAYLTHPYHPLPHYRLVEPHPVVDKHGKRRTVSGKILVRRSEFDRWMEGFRYTPDVDKIVNEVMEELKVS